MLRPTCVEAAERIRAAARCVKDARLHGSFRPVAAQPLGRWVLPPQAAARDDVGRACVQPRRVRRRELRLNRRRAGPVRASRREPQSFRHAGRREAVRERHVNGRTDAVLLQAVARFVCQSTCIAEAVVRELRQAVVREGEGGVNVLVFVRLGAARDFEPRVGDPEAVDRAARLSLCVEAPRARRRRPLQIQHGARREAATRHDPADHRVQPFAREEVAPEVLQLMQAVRAARLVYAAVRILDPHSLAVKHVAQIAVARLRPLRILFRLLRTATRRRLRRRHGGSLRQAEQRRERQAGAQGRRHGSFDRHSVPPQKFYQSHRNAVAVGVRRVLSAFRPSLVASSKLAHPKAKAVTCHRTPTAATLPNKRRTPLHFGGFCPFAAAG